MADLYDKRERARNKFIGQKVRRIFSDGPYRRCTNVVCHGPPSGWACVFELQLEDGDDIKVERMKDIEIEPEKG